MGGGVGGAATTAKQGSGLKSEFLVAGRFGCPLITWAKEPLPKEKQ